MRKEMTQDIAESNLLAVVFAEQQQQPSATATLQNVLEKLRRYLKRAAFDRMPLPEAPRVVRVVVSAAA